LIQGIALFLIGGLFLVTASYRARHDDWRQATPVVWRHVLRLAAADYGRSSILSRPFDAPERLKVAVQFALGGGLVVAGVLVLFA
jgi:hypothetical protein